MQITDTTDYTLNQDKIISHFGRVFFDKVIRNLSVYSDKWQLFDIRQIDYYSINCLFTCKSRLYGNCVLKISKTGKELETEYHTLLECSETHFCKAYNADTSEGVLLIEQIIPGTQLRAIADLQQRLNAFCEVFQSIHKSVKQPCRYPSYLDWVSRIADYMRKRECFSELSHFMAEAEVLCKSLFERYDERILLHGDLHHDNILLGNDGKYKVIDPKGVIGPAVFDIPRFVLNEFDTVTDDAFKEKYDYMLQFLSKRLSVPFEELKRLVYIETCMANCWNVESGDSPEMAQVYFTHTML